MLSGIMKLILQHPVWQGRSVKWPEGKRFKSLWRHGVMYLFPGFCCFHISNGGSFPMSDIPKNHPLWNLKNGEHFEPSAFVYILFDRFANSEKHVNNARLLFVINWVTKHRICTPLKFSGLRPVACVMSHSSIILPWVTWVISRHVLGGEGLVFFSIWSCLQPLLVGGWATPLKNMTVDWDD